MRRSCTHAPIHSTVVIVFWKKNLSLSPEKNSMLNSKAILVNPHWPWDAYFQTRLIESCHSALHPHFFLASLVQFISLFSYFNIKRGVFLRWYTMAGFTSKWVWIKCIPNPQGFGTESLAVIGWCFSISQTQPSLLPEAFSYKSLSVSNTGPWLI